MIFQDWSCKGNKFHDPIHIGDCNYVHITEVNKGGFFKSPQDLDRVATLSPIRPPPEPPS